MSDSSPPRRRHWLRNFWDTLNGGGQPMTPQTYGTTEPAIPPKPAEPEHLDEPMVPPKPDTVLPLTLALRDAGLVLYSDGRVEGDLDKFEAALAEYEHDSDFDGDEEIVGREAVDRYRHEERAAEDKEIALLWLVARLARHHHALKSIDEAAAHIVHELSKRKQDAELNEQRFVDLAAKIEKLEGENEELRGRLSQLPGRAEIEQIRQNLLAIPGQAQFQQLEQRHTALSEELITRLGNLESRVRNIETRPIRRGRAGL